MSIENKNINVLQLFEEKKLVKVCAPMVRYSKLQFRDLVRNYDCDLCFTPMMLADSICKSEKARRNEFTTNTVDSPLIAQLASNTVHDFVGAANFLSPFCNGIDLNCGCPQRWAKQLGLGCAMLENPQVIFDIVKQCRNHIAKPFTISVKIRLLGESRKTVEICRQIEKAGASVITVHGRMPHQNTGEINRDLLRLINDSITIPVIANGGVKSLEEAFELQEQTGCRGVMVANALLQNPTLFSGTNATSLECVQQWVDICYNSTLSPNDYNHHVSKPEHTIKEKPPNLTFQCFHHHLVFMLEKLLPRRKRQIFNNLQTFKDVLDFLESEFDIVVRLFSPEKFQKRRHLDLNFDGRHYLYEEMKPKSNELTDETIFNYSGGGSYFKSKVKEVDEDECDWSDIFTENG